MKLAASSIVTSVDALAEGTEEHVNMVQKAVDELSLCLCLQKVERCVMLVEAKRMGINTRFLSSVWLGHLAC